MSNRERIARAAEEAKATAAEKAAKQSTKAPSSGARAKRAPKPPARMKIVWQVSTVGGVVVKTFAYPEKAEAEAEIAKLAKTGRTHLLLATKVPME